ncbi:DNA polymerase III subunit beta [Ignatzschineria cameli]|uniref:Beta sliding clamp n=1 Tax=Ignatzschineria cameli TaxID=2182793 RepID=A0A2U2ALK0_9GAMM|nr:DNA polymerase III subunit beta [Ignatzschineria cameli]PWD83607.1 DNA polymerase III subunit beta [Ignatzschineria cameli]PWD84027.1 DNA polymerase III subunit beta [Ignatzschineria cameli]PWD89034.1 DNA polymerase III subunit beta [Ignatzschineria cameli]PWD90086.1 DNA polymerase III subunit beta [Ignatzschineria cameli]PWD90749.1 DNA polymerase III subunit beta [Ignatzschineria cameli]
MKLVIQREQLMKPLQAIIGVIDRTQTLPILANVKCVASDDEITLTTTDLEIELTCSFPHIPVEQGSITFPARKLFDILKALPEGIEVQIEVDNLRAIITAGRSRFTLSCLPVDEYPVSDHLEFEKTLTLPKNELRRLIEKVAFSMAVSDVRYFLNGLLLDVNGTELNAVATDGHRLSVSYLQLPESSEMQKQLIIPRKGVEELLKLIENESAPVHLELSENHLRVELGSIVFTTKLIDGKFPDYKRVVPPLGDKIIVADRVGLIEALNRASVLSQDKFRGIRFTVSDYLLKLQVNNPEQEQAEEEVEVNYQGETFTTAFNVGYLIDALKVLDDDMVRLSFTAINSSCLIQNSDSDGVSYVVMPMRL